MNGLFWAWPCPWSVNAPATAASTGSDLNGWAAYEAANTIKTRMIAFAAEHFGVNESEIEFDDGNVRIANALDAELCRTLVAICGPGVHSVFVAGMTAGDVLPAGKRIRRRRSVSDTAPPKAARIAPNQIHGTSGL